MRPAESSPVATHHIDAGDDLRVHFSESGRGPPLLLLHGFTGSVESWGTLIPGLTPRFRVIAVDLPGHGHSSAPASPDRYALTRFAADLVTACDALGLSQVAVLGYSLGARAALHFAARHPGRIASMVLVSASPGIADARRRSERAAADERLAEELDREGIAPFVARWESLPLWESQGALPPVTREALRNQRLRNDAHGLANSLRGAGQGASAALDRELAAIACRVLLVAGALDTPYVVLGTALARALPHARLAVVAGAGHAVHLERPRELLHLVLDFLDSG